MKFSRLFYPGRNIGHRRLNHQTSLDDTLDSQIHLTSCSTWRLNLKRDVDIHEIDLWWQRDSPFTSLAWNEIGTTTTRNDGDQEEQRTIWGEKNKFHQIFIEGNNRYLEEKRNIWHQWMIRCSIWIDHLALSLQPYFPLSCVDRLHRGVWIMREVMESKLALVTTCFNERIPRPWVRKDANFVSNYSDKTNPSPYSDHRASTLIVRDDQFPLDVYHLKRYGDLTQA